MSEGCMYQADLPFAAGNVTDDIGPRVQGAANSTKDKVNDVLPSGVKNAAGSVGDRANIIGEPLQHASAASLWSSAGPYSNWIAFLEDLIMHRWLLIPAKWHCDTLLA